MTATEITRRYAIIIDGDSDRPKHVRASNAANALASYCEENNWHTRQVYHYRHAEQHTDVADTVACGPRGGRKAYLTAFAIEATPGPAYWLTCSPRLAHLVRDLNEAIDDECGRTVEYANEDVTVVRVTPRVLGVLLRLGHFNTESLAAAKALATDRLRGYEHDDDEEGTCYDQKTYNQAVSNWAATLPRATDNNDEEAER